MHYLMLFYLYFVLYIPILKKRYEEGISLRSWRKGLIDSGSSSAFQIWELSSNRKVILTEGKAELDFSSYYPENNSQVG